MYPQHRRSPPHHLRRCRLYTSGPSIGGVFSELPSTCASTKMCRVVAFPTSRRVWPGRKIYHAHLGPFVQRHRVFRFSLRNSQVLHKGGVGISVIAAGELGSFGPCSGRSEIRVASGEGPTINRSREESGPAGSARKEFGKPGKVDSVRAIVLQTDFIGMIRF